MNNSEFKLNLAVVIGINDYRNGVPKLGTARQDAEAIASILKTEYQYQVHLITDTTTTQATSKNLQVYLETALPEILKKANPSRLLFYFAGHGIALNGDDGPQGYLILQDAKLGDVSTYLPMQQVEAALTTLSCRHCLVILDCCFAGAFRWSSTRKLVSIPETIHKERYDRFIQDPAWQVITSAASDQYANDCLAIKGDRGIAKTNTNHSPFAAALMDALSGKADAYPAATNGKPSGDGVITATELYLYLRDAVEPTTKDHSQRQTPGLWPLKNHDKGEYIFLAPGHPLNLPPAPPLDESKNPYRGLESFEEEHSAFFFGRTASIEKLYEFVSSHPLTVVLGASGSGKSSLVKAGLVPYLKQQLEVKSNPQWQILAPFRPGESPLKALNKTLAREKLAVESISQLGVEEKVANLSTHLAAWSQQHPNTRILLVIDQFEELITLCKNEQEREQFLVLLAQAVAKYPNQLRLVLTLRSDFEPRFRDTALKKDWNDSRFVVSQMTRADLREAIEKPAEKQVMYFEPHELVEQLIDEVADMPGALPLLSFALSELYLKYLRRQRDAQNIGETIDRALTQADYQCMGGVIQSLTQRADEEYETLVKEDPAYAQIIRQVMLRMVAISGGELARRRVPTTELEYSGLKNEQAKKVIKHFSEARLLVPGLDTENQAYVEPVHDALIIGWAKIKYWLDEKQEIIKQRSGWNPIKNLLIASKVSLSLASKENGSKSDRPEAEKQLKVNLPLQRELTTAAQNWSKKKESNENKKAAGFLWNGDPRLPQLEQIQQSEDNWFNQTETQFVEGSIIRRRWNIRIRWILTGIAFAVLGGIAISIWYQLQISQMREKAARVKNLLETDPVEGLVLAIQTIGQNRSTPIVNMSILPEVQSSLLTAVQTAKERNRFQESGVVTGVAFSHDGQKIVSGNGCLRDLQGDGEPIKLNVEGSIYGISFSPDGKTIVGSVANTEGEPNSNQNQVKFWDVQGNPIPLPFQDAHSPIVSAAFSPDGETIVSGHIDGSVSLWNKQSKRIIQFSQKHKPISPHTPQVDQVTFSSDGQMIFSHSRDGIHQWNLRDGSFRSFLKKEADRGDMSNMSEGNNCSSASSASPPNGFALYNASFSFSRNSKYMIYNGLQDYFMTLPEGGEQAINDPAARPLAISPDGTSFVGVDEAENVMLRSVNPDGVLSRSDGEFKPIDQPFRSPNYTVLNAAFSPDGQTIVTGGLFGDIRLWDIRGISPVKQVQLLHCNREDSCPPIAISLNGQHVAVSDQNGSIKLLDRNGQETGQTIETGQGKIISLEFSASGQKIITKAEDQSGAGVWSLWDIKGSKIRDFTTDNANNAINYLAVSPNEKSIIIQSAESGITLLNSDGEPLGQSVKHPEFSSGNSLGVTFSPNGEQLISFEHNINGAQGLNSKELTCLWNVRADSLIPKKIPGGKGEEQNCQETSLISFVAFSPDGKTVALATSTSEGSQNTVELWDLKSNQIGRPFQAPNVTSIAFSPDGKTIASRGYDGMIRLSNLQGAPIGRPFVGRLEGYSSRSIPIRELIFSPDGKTLISASTSGVLQQWPIDSEQWLQVACNRLKHHQVFKNPTTDEGKGAKKTCEKNVWNLAQKLGQNGEINRV